MRFAVYRTEEYDYNSKELLCPINQLPTSKEKTHQENPKLLYQIHTQFMQVKIKSIVYRLWIERRLQPLPLGYPYSDLPRRSCDKVSPWNCWNLICQNNADPTLPRCAEPGWWSPLEMGVREEQGKKKKRFTQEDIHLAICCWDNGSATELYSLYCPRKNRHKPWIL